MFDSMTELGQTCSADFLEAGRLERGPGLVPPATPQPTRSAIHLLTTWMMGP